MALLSPAEETTSVPPTVSGITEKHLLQHFVPFPFSPLENKEKPAGSDLLPAPPPTPPSPRGGRPSLPPPWTSGEPQEEGPCELAVAMATAALEFDHWGPGVGGGELVQAMLGAGRRVQRPRKAKKGKGRAGVRLLPWPQFPHL